MATIVEDGHLYTVPVISGDMLKYWHMKHLSEIAQDRNLPLCLNAQRKSPNPNRIKEELSDAKWVEEKFPPAVWDKMKAKKKADPSTKREIEQALYQVVAKECLVTDAHGILITEIAPQNKTGATVVETGVAVARTSRVQVGFMTGIPRRNATEHYFHAKFVSSRTGIQARENKSNEGQNIFTRPATSAEFAIVVAIDLEGLGFDDAANKHVVESGQLALRKKSVIDALSYTLMSQPGANTSQQLPHIMSFEGALVTSTSRCPAPSVSAIKADYLDILEKLVETSNMMSDSVAVSMKRLNSLADAVTELSALTRVIQEAEVEGTEPKGLTKD